MQAGIRQGVPAAIGATPHSCRTRLAISGEILVSDLLKRCSSVCRISNRRSDATSLKNDFREVRRLGVASSPDRRIRQARSIEITLGRFGVGKVIK
jgi:hypothetical protein